MAERLRLFLNDTEIDFSELKIDKSKDTVVDNATVSVPPNISGLQSGTRLTVTNNDESTNIAKLEVQEKSDDMFSDLQCLSNGFELNNVKVEKVYPSGTAPEDIVQDVIDNYTKNLSYESTWDSGFTLEKRYIANAYAIDVVRDMMDLLDAQLRIEPDDSVYFELRGSIDNGKKITNGDGANITDWNEDKQSLFNDIKIRGGFENFNNSKTFTGDGSQTEFTLAKEPQGGVVVYIDESEEDPDNYEVRFGEKKIIFDSAPSDGANIQIDYNYNRPVVVRIDDEDSKAENWGTVREDIEAPWLESFKEARKYGRQLLNVYSYPLVQATITIPFVNLDYSIGELIRVVDNVRGKDKNLVINKITYRNDKTVLKLGTRELLLYDWQREVQDRIKKLERRAETSEVITFSKLLTQNLKVKLTPTLTAQWNSPVDSFILGHTTLGRMRSSINIEVDCSDSDGTNTGTWKTDNSGDLDGEQFDTSGFRLSCGSFDGDTNQRYIEYTGSVSSVKSIAFLIDPDTDNESLITLTTDINITLDNGSVSLNGASGTVEEDSVDWGTFVYIELDSAVTVDNLLVGKVDSGYYSGLMDELMFFDIALTDDNKTDLKNKNFYSNSSLYSDCLLWYSFDNPKLGDRSTAKQDLPI